MKSKQKSQRPFPPPTRRSNPPGSAHDPEAILALARSVIELHQRMIALSAPVVTKMIRSRTRDQPQIEHLLDRLLDCAGSPDGRDLFRSLCRYYFSINPIATADYIHAYREMWDSEESGKEQVS
jgi:hypothetical protein